MDPNEVAELSAGSSVNEVRPSQGALDTSLRQFRRLPTCGGGAGSPVSYVYALGQIETRFPRPSVEKEVAQATGRAETAGQTDRQAFHQIFVATREPLSCAAIVLGPDRSGTRNLHPAAARPGGSRSSHRRSADRRSGPVDQHGHRGSRPRCPAGILQRAHDPDRGIRPDLHFFAGCADRGDPPAGGDTGRAVWAGGPRVVRHGSCR